jgi:hypothetical protein
LPFNLLYKLQQNMTIHSLLFFRTDMKALITSLAIATVLAGCSDSGSSRTSAADSSASNTNQTAQLNTRIIDNEDLTPGLKGIDADHNGIRDDIDRLIAQKYSATPAMKKAAQQEARTLQRGMETITRREALATGDESMRAGACTFKTLPHATEQDAKFREQLSKELEALTANTKERFTAYWKAEELKGGTVFSQPDEPVCD